MSRGYAFENPAQTDGIPGDLSTPTTWNVAFEASRLAKYNALAALIDVDVSALFDAVGVAGLDTLVYSYKDAATVTVAPGLAAADDGTQSYTVASATDVDCTGLGNSKLCFLWIGENSIDGATVLRVNTDEATTPTNLLHAHRLRWFFQTNGSGQVVQFAPPKLNCDRGVSYQYNGAYRPLNCLLEDGSTLGKAGSGATFAGDVFASLYDEIGATFGGTKNWAAGNTVNVPDSRGRAMIGAGQGSGLTNRALGATVGEEGHANTLAENGPHQHGETHGANLPGYLAGGGSTEKSVTHLNNALATNGRQMTDSSGSGTPHQTMQPSIAKYMIIAY